MGQGLREAVAEAGRYREILLNALAVSLLYCLVTVSAARAGTDAAAVLEAIRREPAG